MERLTYWNKDMECWSYHGSSEEAAIRLAAYEDTELEPEEIVSVQEEPWCVFYFNRRCNLDGDFCPEGPGCPQEMSPEDALRLLKLAQAEKDGRLVVLPCKPGQMVWAESPVRGRTYSFEAPDIAWIIENTERFGKEIFLTREEDEAAPKKREEADNAKD